MKIKKELLIIIIISVIVIIGVVVGSCKFLNKTSSNANTKESSEKTNNNKIELNLTNSYTITEKGSYKLSGTIENGLITINTTDEVILILNGITITNNSGPCIYVENAKSVIIKLNENTTNTLTDGSNYSNVELDACIYSKDDLTIEGKGTLIVNANYKDGIISKDDLTIKSGIISITSKDDAIKGKDSVTIDGGTITIDSKGDGIKTTNEEDKAKGIITVNDGTLNIKCVKDGFDSINKVIINGGTIKIDSNDDGIHADGYIEINKGDLTINGLEGLEATYIKINNGNINISASDDGINCTNKSNDYTVICEINGGNTTIKMAQGDTDGIDSNGNLYINGGTINITGQSPFDYDGEAKYTGGTMIVNGEETTQITNQFMGGPGNMMNDEPRGAR